MSRAKALRELSDNSVIIARLVDEEVAADYKYRGTFYRRSSPLQFVAADRRAHIIEKAPTTWKGGAAQAIQDGRKALKTTIERVVEASPNLMTLPACVRKVCTLHVCMSSVSLTISTGNRRRVQLREMKAATHHPYSHASNDTAATLYTLIAVIYLDINGADALDRWVRRNIAPLLEDVASVPHIR